MAWDSGVPARPAGMEGDAARVGRGGLVALCLVILLGVTNNVALGAFLPVVAVDLRTTVPLLGQIVTVVSLLAVPLALLIGPLADQYGHRRMILIGVLLTVASAAASALAPDYPTLLVARLLSAPGGAIMVSVPLAVAGSVFTGDGRRRALSWLVAAFSGGSILGLPLLTTVGAAFGWRAGFGILALFLAALIPAVARLPHPTPVVGGAFSPRTIAVAYAPLVRHGPMLLVFGAASLRAVGWLGMLTYLGAFYAERHGLDTRQIGYTYMAGGAGYFLGSLAAGTRLGRFSPRHLCAATTALVALLLAIAFALPAGVLSVTLLLTLSAVAASFGWVCLTTILTTETPAGGATTMVLTGAFMNLGGALGGALGGVLLALGSYPALGFGLSLAILASVPLLWWPNHRSRPAEALAVPVAEP